MGRADKCRASSAGLRADATAEARSIGEGRLRPSAEVKKSQSSDNYLTRERICAAKHRRAQIEAEAGAHRNKEKSRGESRGESGAESGGEISSFSRCEINQQRREEEPEQRQE